MITLWSTSKTSCSSCCCYSLGHRSVSLLQIAACWWTCLKPQCSKCKETKTGPLEQCGQSIGMHSWGFYLFLQCWMYYFERERFHWHRLLLWSCSILDPEPQTGMWFAMPSKTRYHSKHCICIPQKVKLAKPKAAASSQSKRAFNWAPVVVWKLNILRHWPWQ